MQTYANSPKNRASLAYKTCPKGGERKPGLKVVIGRECWVFYWIDLQSVHHSPDAVEEVEVEGEKFHAVERLTFSFGKQTLTVKGYYLLRILDDAQEHRADVLRLSSKETIMAVSSAPPALPVAGEEPPSVIASITLKKPDKPGK